LPDLPIDDRPHLSEEFIGGFAEDDRLVQIPPYSHTPPTTTEDMSAEEAQKTTIFYHFFPNE